MNGAGSWLWFSSGLRKGLGAAREPCVGLRLWFSLPDQCPTGGPTCSSWYPQALAPALELGAALTPCLGSGVCGGVTARSFPVPRPQLPAAFSLLAPCLSRNPPPGRAEFSGRGALL